MPDREPSAFTSIGDIISDRIDPIKTIQVSQEAPWDSAGEDLLRVWLATAKQQATSHRKHGFRTKRFYKLFGISSIVTAAIVFLIANLELSVLEGTDTIVHVFAAFINLLIVNLNGFLDYGPKYQRHFEFEGNFAKIAIDIDEILAIDPDFRSPKDRTLAEYKEKIGNLVRSAPET